MTTTVRMVGQGVGALAALVLTIATAQSQGRGGFQVLGGRPPDVPPVVGQPLETRPAVGHGQAPAFAGQTRAAAVATKTPIDVTVVARGLHAPWGLAFLPSGAGILVTEKVGTMRVVGMDGAIGPGIEGVPPVLYGGDAGLLDLALDPAFASNRRIYFCYVERRDDGNGLTVARARLSDDARALEQVTPVLIIEPSEPITAHYGSRLLFDSQGRLLVSVGERFTDDVRVQAQDLGSDLGKILRINTDGTPATGNPFASTPGARPEIWAYGVRNPQGLTFNPATGALWETEHGPQGGDEVNIIEPGRNYGWPVIAYGTEYDGRPIDGGLTAKAGMEQPAYYWDPAIAPSGATFYDADAIPEWKNNLFVAAHAGEHLVRLVIDGRRVVGEERLLLDQHQRMRDVAQGPDGALWVITDDRRDGRLIRLAAHGR
jgi:glucose/arabinose dehydrogenase